MSNHTRHDYPLCTVADIRALEQALFRQKDSFEVMQQAAQALFDVICADFPHPERAPTVHIFLGAGNNAGDGMLVGALLKQHGYQVNAYTVFDTPFQGDALKAYQMSEAQGLHMRPFAAFDCAPSDIFIEAIFGIGLNRPAAGRAREAIRHINACKKRYPNCHVYAVDVPAGIMADTGARMGEALNADTTVTFIADKVGLHTGEGRGYAGKVIVNTLQANKPNADQYTFLTDYSSLEDAQKSHQFHHNTHKGDYGHALVVGGGMGMFGAAALSAVSTLKVGAGKSSLYTHDSYASQYHMQDTPLYEVMRAQHLNELTPYSAIILGVGLGREDWGAQVFAQTLSNIGEQPLLLDADGLWHLPTLDKPTNISVITPHEGEAAKLLHCSVADIRQHKPNAVRELAIRYECIAVLKGSGTLVSDGKSVWINQTGNVCLATGGSGDVLAGMIGGYLAQGFTALDAALFGVYRHGLAADKYLAQHGDKTMRASDLWKFI